MGGSLIRLDGSIGEGGGQVVRSALSLAMITGQAVRIQHIRTGRSKPGLANQHLTALQAAKEISGAVVEGDEIGSQEVFFQPGAIQPGNYQFQITTAGSTSLVLQTLFLPLAFATSPSSLEVVGGTHVAWSPCYHYLAWLWLPYLGKMGLRGELFLKQCGYFPQGGGKISATIQPSGNLLSLQCLERGQLVQIRGLSAVTNLPEEIARRQRQRFIHRLGSRFPLNDLRVRIIPGVGKGTFLVVLVEYEHATACYFSLGERGKRAEEVADEVAESVMTHHQSPGCLDPYLCDQLLIPLCFGNQPSEMKLTKVTNHLITNAEVIRHFLPVNIKIQGDLNQPGKMVVEP